MKETIEISVLVPVYNAEKTIRACVWSVLNQSYENYELLLYLDGCTDNTIRVLQEFNDPRIRLVISKKNEGIVHARNALVQEAKGRFIAWLDADDIALPDRLASQYEFLDVHPHLMVMGSWIEVRNGRNISRVKWPTEPAVLDAWMFFRNPFVQSSLMLRNVSGMVAYDASMEYLEDYAFCSRFLGQKSVAIYPEYLCSYLEDTEKARIDKYLRYDFVGKLEKIMKANFALLDLHPGINELSLIREFLRNSKKLKLQECKIVRNFLFSVRKQNHRKKLFEISAMDGVVGFQLMRLLKTAPALSPGILWFMVWHPGMLFYAIKSRVKYYA